VRAPFFRICTDATLRGPDSGVIATYTGRRWQLGRRACHEFHCAGSIVLRVTNQDGVREQLGPFDFVRASDGALFSGGACLGIHSAEWAGEMRSRFWSEVAFLDDDRTRS
jgi:hypothetical protein